MKDKREKFMDQLRSEMINRDKFKYGYKDILGYIFC